MKTTMKLWALALALVAAIGVASEPPGHKAPAKAKAVKHAAANGDLARCASELLYEVPCRPDQQRRHAATAAGR